MLGLGMLDDFDYKEKKYNSNQKNIYKFKINDKDARVVTIECEVCRHKFYNIEIDQKYEKKIKAMKDQSEREKELKGINENLPKDLKDSLKNKDGSMPINASKCPNCGSSSKRFKKVMNSKERKEELKKKLEEEKNGSELDPKVIDNVCSYIYDEFLSSLKKLKKELFKDKISIKHFHYMLYKQTMRIVDYNKKEYYPSKHFIKYMKETVNDFGDDVEELYAHFCLEMEEMKVEADENGYRKGYVKYIKKALKKDSNYEIKDIIRKDRKYINREIRKEMK